MTAPGNLTNFAAKVAAGIKALQDAESPPPVTRTNEGATAQLERTTAAQEGAAPAYQARGQYAWGCHEAKASEVPPELDYPPGAMGDLARAYYAASIRPVQTISIGAALASACGITGLSWQISKTGLNLYITVVAESGVGKEAISENMGILATTISTEDQSEAKFFYFGSFQSAPALLKYLAENENRSIVNYMAEFGKRLRIWAHEKSPAENGVYQKVLELYQKSSQHSRTGGLGYSDAMKDVSDFAASAFSMIGDTTPDGFNASVTHGMIEDGLMSRLSVLEYKGLRPKANHERQLVFPENVVTTWRNIASQSRMLMSNGKATPVGISPEAETLLSNYDDKCDEALNSGQLPKEQRPLINRADLKVRKICGLMAVADNCYQPLVTTLHVEWAIKFVEKSNEAFISRWDSGDVGNGSDAQIKKLVGIVTDYLAHKPPASYSNVAPEAMRANGIVQLSYLQKRVASASQFKNRDGAYDSRILKEAVQQMCDFGNLELLKEAEVLAFGTRSKCYRIIGKNK